MNSQECQIAVLKTRLAEEIGRSVGLAVDLNMQAEQIKALEAEVAALKAPKKKAKPAKPALAAVA